MLNSFHFLPLLLYILRLNCKQLEQPSIVYSTIFFALCVFFLFVILFFLLSVFIFFSTRLNQESFLLVNEQNLLWTKIKIKNKINFIRRKQLLLSLLEHENCTYFYRKELNVTDIRMMMRLRNNSRFVSFSFIFI